MKPTMLMDDLLKFTFLDLTGRERYRYISTVSILKCLPLLRLGWSEVQVPGRLPCGQQRPMTT